MGSYEEDSDSESSGWIRDSERNFLMFEDVFEMLDPRSFPWNEETKKYDDFFESSDWFFSSYSGLF